MIDRWQKLFDEARRENGLNNAGRADELVALAIQEAECLSPGTPNYSSAQGSFAIWRYVQDRFAEAEVFQKRYIESEKRVGIGERELANLTRWLAEMQQKQGKLDDAKQTIENAIGTYPDGCLPELSGAYNDLASVLEEMGDSGTASAAKRKAAELQKEWDEIVESRKPTT
jgi:hypothetical protein